MRSKKLQARFTRIFQNWPAKVLSLGAAVLLYTLTGINSLDERYLTVPVQINLPEELSLVSQSIQKVQVNLRGNSQRVWDIAEQDIQVGADFSDVRVEGVFRRPLVLSKRGNAVGVEPLELTLSTESIEIELQEYQSKSVAVIPQFSSQPATGYQLGTTGVSPEDVVLGGPRQLLEPIDRLQTAPVDLSGRTGSFTQRVELILPDDRLMLESQATVEVRGTISEAVILTSFEDVDVIVLDSPVGLILNTVPNPGVIRVQGPQNLIDQIQPEQIRIVADAGAINGPGVYSLPTRPEVPRGLLILGYTPVEVQVEFIPRDSFPGELNEQDNP